MTPKIVALVITLIANAAISVVVLAAMIIALNGYSEIDATYGLVTWLILVLISILLTCSAAFLGVQKLLNREVATEKAVLIVTSCTTVVGLVLNIVCGLIGIGTAEIVRTYY